MLNIGSHNVRIGDTARFPIGRLGSDDIYRHRWAINAFTRDGIVMRRLHDGLERTISAHWFEQYRTNDSDHGPMNGRSLVDRNAAGLPAVQLRRLAAAAADLQTDPDAPGFYVTARHGQKTAFLLGPFRSLYSALQVVREGKYAAREYDVYGQYAYGTARLERSSAIRGKFNQTVFEKD